MNQASEFINFKRRYNLNIDIKDARKARRSSYLYKKVILLKKNAS